MIRQYMDVMGAAHILAAIERAEPQLQKDKSTYKYWNPTKEMRHQ